MNTFRCAVYTRKSTDEGLDQNFNSLDAQRESCEAFIKSQAHEGWKLVSTRYDDGGFSGGNLQRPALQKLLNDVAAGRVNVVVVYKVDRLTRSLADFSKIIEILDGANASFVAVTQHFNTTTSMGRLTLNVLLSFAQFEREVTGERIRDKIAASKRKGMWMGGVPPLGYDLRDRKLHVNEAEAKVVRQIYDCYLKTEDVAAVRDELRKKRIPSKKWTSSSGLRRGGVEFGRGALYRILRNRLYLGQIQHRDHIYQGEHQGILPVDIWDRVQGILDGKKRGGGGSNSDANHYTLRNILFDESGNSLRGTFTQKKKSRRYRYYVSAPMLGHGDKATSSLIRIPAQAIEQIIEDRVRTLLTIPGQTPVERRDITSCIQRCVVSRSQIRMTINVENRSVDMSRIQHDADTIERIGDQVTLIVATKLGRNGIRHAMTMPDGKSVLTAQKPNQLLLRNLTQAHDWRRLLSEGKGHSVQSIAKANNCNQRYVRKLLQLAYLAPDIVEAILDGRQPETLQLKHLTDRALPLDWASQRSSLGYCLRN